MAIIANIVVALVALAHLYFLVLEMFLWTGPMGLRTFGMTQEFAKSTEVLAANQGLYNGFLAAGLIWSLLAGEMGRALFFLGCVIVAGIYGGLTAKITILYVQAAPAALAMILVLLTRTERRRFL